MARMMEMLPEDDMPVLPADGGTARADLYGCGRPDSIILSEREALIMLHRYYGSGNGNVHGRNMNPRIFFFPDPPAIRPSHKIFIFGIVGTIDRKSILPPFHHSAKFHVWKLSTSSFFFPLRFLRRGSAQRSVSVSVIVMVEGL